MENTTWAHSSGQPAAPPPPPPPPPTDPGGQLFDGFIISSAHKSTFDPSDGRRARKLDLGLDLELVLVLVLETGVAWPDEFWLPIRLQCVPQSYVINKYFCAEITNEWNSMRIEGPPIKNSISLISIELSGKKALTWVFNFKLMQFFWCLHSI